MLQMLPIDYDRGDHAMLSWCYRPVVLHVCARVSMGYLSMTSEQVASRHTGSWPGRRVPCLPVIDSAQAWLVITSLLLNCRSLERTTPGSLGHKHGGFQ